MRFGMQLKVFVSSFFLVNSVSVQTGSANSIVNMLIHRNPLCPRPAWNQVFSSWKKDHTKPDKEPPQNRRSCRQVVRQQTLLIAFRILWNCEVQETKPMHVSNRCFGPDVPVPLLLESWPLSFLLASMLFYFAPPDGSRCRDSRRKAIQAGSRGGGSVGIRGVGRGNGRGRGNAARSGQARGRGERASGGPPPGRVFELPRCEGDQSMTVAVRTGNADNWVVTSVSRGRRTSSSSRTPCQR